MGECRGQEIGQILIAGAVMRGDEDDGEIRLVIAAGHAAQRLRDLSTGGGHRVLEPGRLGHGGCPKHVVGSHNVVSSRCTMTRQPREA